MRKLSQDLFLFWDGIFVNQVYESSETLYLSAK